MKKTLNGILSIAILSLAFTSCKKDSTGTPSLTAVTVTNLIADTIHDYSAMGAPIGGTGKYNFYSLERGAIVPDTSVATWDLGFKGTTIIINGGTSGTKSGGAFVQQGTFASVSSVSVDSIFRVDNAPTAYAITKGSGNGWYSYDFASNLISPIPGRVLIIRTASGKYAKVEILSYYKDGIMPASTASNTVKALNERYYKFQYIYQANGTMNF